jgi:hypothetical protein
MKHDHRVQKRPKSHPYKNVFKDPDWASEAKKKRYFNWIRIFKDSMKMNLIRKKFRKSVGLDE